MSLSSNLPIYNPMNSDTFHSNMHLISQHKMDELTIDHHDVLRLKTAVETSVLPYFDSCRGDVLKNTDQQTREIALLMLSYCAMIKALRPKVFEANKNPPELLEIAPIRVETKTLRELEIPLMDTSPTGFSLKGEDFKYPQLMKHIFTQYKEKQDAGVKLNKSEMDLIRILPLLKITQ
jgi:hypothetical protein